MTPDNWAALWGGLIGIGTGVLLILLISGIFWLKNR